MKTIKKLAKKAIPWLVVLALGFFVAVSLYRHPATVSADEQIPQEEKTLVENIDTGSNDWKLADMAVQEASGALERALDHRQTVQEKTRGLRYSLCIAYQVVRVNGQNVAVNKNVCKQYLREIPPAAQEGTGEQPDPRADG